MLIPVCLKVAVLCHLKGAGFSGPRVFYADYCVCEDQQCLSLECSVGCSVLSSRA